jgi:hypothetical protein
VPIAYRSASQGPRGEVCDNGLSPDMNSRVNVYLMKNVGVGGLEKIKAKMQAKGDSFRPYVMKYILTSLIRKMWKYPD